MFHQSNNHRSIYFELLKCHYHLIVPKLQFFDDIWIDAEGGEFGFLNYFFYGGVLDENDITVCQMNFEVGNIVVFRHFPKSI